MCKMKKTAQYCGPSVVRNRFKNSLSCSPSDLKIINNDVGDDIHFFKFSFHLQKPRTG